MKLVSEMAKNMLDKIKPDKSTLCSHVSTPWGIVALPKAILSDEKTCEYCEGRGHYTPLVDPALSSDRTWLCANPLCEAYNATKAPLPTPSTAYKKKAVEWPLFCEINGIGDEHHGVKFENITQSSSKVAYLLKFAQHPRGIILMRGDTGTGKTYSSMAVCEYFTRTNTSAIFSTQKQLLIKWLDTYKNLEYNPFIDKVNTCSLLVIDDFGTAEMTPGFLSFFMDVINTRMQWSNRGTIISTNLNENDLSNQCGQALLSRICTGQEFLYSGKSKRKKTVL